MFIARIPPRIYRHCPLVRIARLDVCPQSQHFGNVYVGGVVFTGAQQMTYMKNFYESIAWWKTRPLPSAVIMHGALDDAHQPLARSENNDRYVIWFPQGGDAKAGASLKLLDGQGQDHYRALWFNPRSGKTESLVQTLIAARGICILPKRPDGYDWVLLLTRTDGLVIRRHQGFYDRAARRPESPDGISAAIAR